MGVSGTSLTGWYCTFIPVYVSLTLAIDRMPRKCVTGNLGLRSGFHLSNGRDGSEVKKVSRTMGGEGPMKHVLTTASLPHGFKNGQT